MRRLEDSNESREGWDEVRSDERAVGREDCLSVWLFGGAVCGCSGGELVPTSAGLAGLDG